MAARGPFPARTCPALATLLIATAAACSRPLWRLQCAGGNPSMFLALKSLRKSSGLALTLMWLHNPLCWNGDTGRFRVEELSALGVVTCLQRGPVGPATIILDSLSWLLLRRPVPAMCQTLAQIPRAAANAGLRVTRILVLLHGDLHPLGLVDTLHSLARAVVWVGPALEGMRSKGTAHQLASMLQRKRSGKVVKKEEYFSILTGFTLKAFGEPTRNTPPDEDADPHSAVDTAAYLTFNLRLSDIERQARDRVPLPFHFSAQRKSSLLEASAGTGKIYYEPDATDDLDEEDPDDDLDV